MSALTVARSLSERGELVLLRRADDAALELRVNGVFAMDTAHTSAERELARTALSAWRAVHPEPYPVRSPHELQDDENQRLDGTPIRVLVGGLGLGYTVQEVRVDEAVSEVVVVEVEPDLVSWHRAGLIKQTAGCLSDPRVSVIVADVADVVRHMPADSVDVLLLDVDNGPGYLVHDANAALYAAPFLSACRLVLSAGGVLAIWLAEASPTLRADLAVVFGRVEELSVPVKLGRRQSTYTLLLAATGTAP